MFCVRSEVCELHTVWKAQCCLHLLTCAYSRHNWHRYGDSLRSGWRDIMECIMRLHKLGLIPASILAVEGEPPEVRSIT